jgi:MFS family permease
MTEARLQPPPDARDCRMQADSPAAWLRLLASVALMTIGGCGMYVVAVVMPTVQTEFGVARGEASLPYTLTMVGFGIGSIMMGRITDRFGIMAAMFLGVVCLSAGYVLAGMSSTLLQFALVHGLLIGMLGSSVAFAPLIADTSLWFDRRRGIAVGICAAGIYIAGAVWPPLIQHFVETIGWRQTYWAIGAFSLVTMLPLALCLRKRPPATALAMPNPPAAPAVESSASKPLPGFTPGGLQALLCVAGVACCVAMAMPQVHIVAYCSDLGYGAAHGARMLSVAFVFGIVSRVTMGFVCDRIGGLRTLLLGSLLQAVALMLFLPFDGIVSLYVVTALFGLFQGGIVPAYAIIVRDFYPPREAGRRVGVVLTATMFGMALGGWMSGAIFDLTGSYDAAFLNGVAWNLLNVAIVLFLLYRSRLHGLARPGLALG